MTALFLSRARLRRDASVRALAPMLLPEGDAARLLAAHRLVWSLMSDSPGRTRDFLWREEAPGAFLILAPRPAAESGGLFEVEHKPWEPVFREGDQLGFLLRANPTVAGSSRDGKRGRRSDVVMDALYPVAKSDRAQARPAAIRTAGLAWLTRLGAGAGFQTDPCSVAVDGYNTVRIPRPPAKPAKPAKPAEFGTLDFEGVLTVAEPVAFTAAVARGFGRARAFGCGLMLLRRA